MKGDLADGSLASDVLRQDRTDVSIAIKPGTVRFVVQAAQQFFGEGNLDCSRHTMPTSVHWWACAAIARALAKCVRRHTEKKDYCQQALIAISDDRYDAGMTRSKIAISLPKDQLARVHREVRAGRADSVSGYIARPGGTREARVSAGTAAGSDRAVW
jgi:hypothetical protein